MRKWSRNHERCAGCGTAKYPHLAKGYCSRCLPRVKRGLDPVPPERADAGPIEISGKALHQKCRQCKVYKPAGVGPNGEPSEFYRKRDGSGYLPVCIPCKRGQFRRYYGKYADKEKARGLTNKAKARAEKYAKETEG